MKKIFSFVGQVDDDGKLSAVKAQSSQLPDVVTPLGVTVVEFLAPALGAFGGEEFQRLLLEYVGLQSGRGGGGVAEELSELLYDEWDEGCNQPLVNLGVSVSGPLGMSREGEVWGRTITKAVELIQGARTEMLRLKVIVPEPGRQMRVELEYEGEDAYGDIAGRRVEEFAQLWGLPHEEKE